MIYWLHYIIKDNNIESLYQRWNRSPSYESAGNSGVTFLTEPVAVHRFITFGPIRPVLFKIVIKII